MRTGLAGVMAVALLLGACSPIYRNHGYIPPEAELSGLRVGVDTRDGIIASMGQPTTRGVLGDQSLYYVQSRFRHFAFFPPEEVEREVLALSFLPNGTLGNVERFGLEQGRVVQLSPRITAEVFADRTFINQLFGNIGNFDAGTFLGEE
ncbi:MAG TPA: outer membrane protein assembly factor BamE [Rubellimicrobium sp.]|jgi:outer membrane protein assembly factor BamE (lipoprotein component of BamABCDE complex)|nr:outer membrane protein assembly factor BamE [Rubellimicrobium sp.]